MAKDNSTFREKVAIRRHALQAINTDPVICESHGGTGKLYRALYAEISSGMVIEKDQAKFKLLIHQRPTWSVYRGDSERVISAGCGAHLPINFLDLDPYGTPWPVLDAWIDSPRPKAPRLIVVVNDGLRQKIKLGGAWSVGGFEEVTQRFGSDIYDQYLAVCQWLMQQKAAQAGYTLSRFEGYYCGHNQAMTHYLAVLDQSELASFYG